MQRHFTSKSSASKVMISHKGNSRPQPQPGSPRPSQPAHHSHSGFLSEPCGFQDSCKHHPYSFMLPFLGSCFLRFGILFRVKVNLYCLCVHLLGALVLRLRVTVFPLEQSHKTGCVLYTFKANSEISSVFDNNSDLLRAKLQ